MTDFSIGGGPCDSASFVADELAEREPAVAQVSGASAGARPGTPPWSLPASLDLTNEWLDAAKQIGQLEDERARLSPPPSASADINEARLAWVRIANALVANAELARIDTTTDHLLFAPLRAAEKTADTRGKAKSVAATTTAPAKTTATTHPPTPRPNDPETRSHLAQSREAAPTKAT